jgi:signal transduction histidine kinase
MADTRQSQKGGPNGRLAIDLDRARRFLNGAHRSEASPSAKGGEVSERMALLAHEIRASLTAIKGFGITLREHCDDLRPRDRAFAIEAIVRGSDTLLRLADGLLSSGKAQAGVLRLRYERVDLVAVARSVIEAECRLHPDLNIALSVDADMTVIGDPTTLARVLDNLIRNAARHAPGGSRIDVQGTQVLDAVVMSVRNDGDPPPPEVRDRLFEKYSSASDGGTGLGLYLTRLIVEAHGGSVWYAPEKDGTRFAFVLPRRHVARTKRTVRLDP